MADELIPEELTALIHEAAYRNRLDLPAVRGAQGSAARPPPR
jgi:hypothetical protein